MSRFVVTTPRGFLMAWLASRPFTSGAHPLPKLIFPNSQLQTEQYIGDRALLDSFLGFIKFLNNYHETRNCRERICIFSLGYKYSRRRVRTWHRISDSRPGTMANTHPPRHTQRIGRKCITSLFTPLLVSCCFIV